MNSGEACSAEGRKVYAPDTNALLANCHALQILSGNPIPDETEHARLMETLKQRGMKWDGKPNDILLSDIVQREIDDLMHDVHKKDSDTAFLARRARDAITALQEEQPMQIHTPFNFGTRYGSLRTTILMPNGARIFVQEPDPASFSRMNIPNPQVDDWLLHHVLEFDYIGRSLNQCNRTILVTSDAHLRNSAKQRGIQAQDFEFENVADPNQLYQGVTVHPIPSGEIGGLVENLQDFTLAEAEAKQHFGKVPKPNQVLSFYRDLDQTDPDSYYIARFKDGTLKFCHVDPESKHLVRLMREHNATVKYVVPFTEKLNSGEMPVSDIKAELLKFIEQGLTRRIASLGDDKRRHKRESDYRKAAETFRRKVRDVEPADRTDVIRLYNELNGAFPIPGHKYRMGRASDELDEESETFKLNATLNMNKLPKREQVPYVELVLDPRVKIVTVNGPAGCGKTYFALLASLVQTLKGYYGLIKYIRPNVLADEGHGFLKGDYSEKLAPFKTSALNNLRNLFGYSTHLALSRRQRIDSIIESLQNNVVEYESMTYMAGDTWDQQIIILDEAQLFSRAIMKLALGRVGFDSKIIILGDFGQIATAEGRAARYLNKNNSGLAHLISELPGHPLYAHVQLTEKVVHRSEVSLLANRL